MVSLGISQPSTSNFGHPWKRTLLERKSFSRHAAWTSRVWNWSGNPAIFCLFCLFVCKKDSTGCFFFLGGGWWVLASLAKKPGYGGVSYQGCQLWCGTMCLGIKFIRWSNGQYECEELFSFLVEATRNLMQFTPMIFFFKQVIFWFHVIFWGAYVCCEQRSVKHLSCSGLSQMILPDDPSLTRDFVKNWP